MHRILVMNSYSDSIELISKYLASSGYDIIFANNISSAIQKAKVFNPDIIILDIMMTNISGFDACKMLKSDTTTKYIPILILTALDTESIKLRALEVGADDFISKSFDRVSLLSKVNSLIRIKKLGDELKNKYSEIEEKNNILKYHLKMAQKIQQSMVTEYNFNFNNLDIYSKYIPAFYVGGDVYEVIKLDDDNLAIFIADVSGHGISAALLTSMLKLLFKNLLFKCNSTQELLTKMNIEFTNIFNNSIPNIYATAFYGIINTKDHIITYSNAGHSSPLLISDDHISELSIDSFPIGIIENPNYSYKVTTYNDSDLLLFYTDGLSDCLYKDNNSEFMNILKDILLDIKNDSLGRISTILLNQFCNINESHKDERDDVSLILIKTKKQ